MSPQNGSFFLFLSFYLLKCRMKFVPCCMRLLSALSPPSPGRLVSTGHPSGQLPKSFSTCILQHLQGGRALLIIPQDDRGIGHIWRGAEHRLRDGGAGHGAARSHRIPERGWGRQRRRVFQSQFAGCRLLLLLLLWVLLIDVSLNELQLLALSFLGRGRQGLLAEGGHLERRQGWLLQHGGLVRGPHTVPRAHCGEDSIEVGDAGGKLVDHSLQLVHDRPRLQGQGLGGLLGQEEVGLLRRGLQWGGRRHPPVHHHGGAAGLVEANGLSIFFFHHIVQSLTADVGKSQGLALAMVAFSEGFDDRCLIAPCLLALHMHWESVPHMFPLGSLSSTWFRPWHRLSIRTMNKIKMGLFAFTLCRHRQYKKQAHKNTDCFASLISLPPSVFRVLPEGLQKERAVPFNSSNYCDFHPKAITPCWLPTPQPAWKA